MPTTTFARHGRVSVAIPRHPSATSSTTAFTLVELLLAATITALVVSGTAFTLMVANRASRSAGAITQLEALIDEDLAAIRDLSDRYTCCPNSCTADSATIAAGVTAGDCSTNSPGSDDFYAPNQVSTTVNSAAMTAFRAACANGTVTANFIAEFPAAPNPAAPLGLVRSAPLQVSADQHRVQWTYTGTVNGNTVINRVVDIVPTVAAWCP
jgi:type II secretory pathway pseudopilin PulG